MTPLIVGIVGLIIGAVMVEKKGHPKLSKFLLILAAIPLSMLLLNYLTKHGILP